MKLSKRTKKIMIAAVSVIVLAFLCSLTAFADGDKSNFTFCCFSKK